MGAAHKNSQHSYRVSDQSTRTSHHVSAWPDVRPKPIKAAAPVRPPSPILMGSVEEPEILIGSVEEPRPEPQAVDDSITIIIKNSHLDSLVQTGEDSLEPFRQRCLALQAAVLLKPPGALITTRLLLQAKADPLDADEEGVTALHVAALCGTKDVAVALLEANANPNSRAKSDGSSPLHAAAKNGHGCLATVLLEKRALPQNKDEFGATALHYAVKCGANDVLKVMLRNPWSPADPDMIDPQRRTALHHAVLLGKAAEARTLVRAGANMHIKDACGDTALHLAFQRKDDEVALALINSSAPHRRRSPGKSLRAASTVHGEYLVGSLADEPLKPMTGALLRDMPLQPMCESLLADLPLKPMSGELAFLFTKSSLERHRPPPLELSPKSSLQKERLPQEEPPPKPSLQKEQPSPQELSPNSSLRKERPPHQELPPKSSLQKEQPTQQEQPPKSFFGKVRPPQRQVSWKSWLRAERPPQQGPSLRKGRLSQQDLASNSPFGTQQQPQEELSPKSKERPSKQAICCSIDLPELR